MRVEIFLVALMACSSRPISADAEPVTLEEACEAYCEVSLECSPGSFPDLQDCTGACTSEPLNGPECKERRIADWSCLGSLSCDEFERSALVSDPDRPCAEEYEEFKDACH